MSYIMRYPLLPIDDDIPDDSINITTQLLVDYLNEVLEYYGPPCEFCKHFDSFCEKGIRNLIYDLRCGHMKVGTLENFVSFMKALIIKKSKKIKQKGL